MVLSLNRMAHQLIVHAPQDKLHTKCNDFSAKNEWPPNLPNLNLLEYHVWGAMLQAYDKLDNKPSTNEELLTRLEMIWYDLPQKPVARAVQNFLKRLQACMFKAGGHFEHSM